jgi:phage tail-like protein
MSTVRAALLSLIALSMPTTLLAQSAPPDNTDWNNTNRFQVNLEGFPVGEFQGVTLPDVEEEEVVYHDGSKGQEASPADAAATETLTFTRGYALDETFEQWFDRIQSGEDDRRDLNIQTLDERDTVLESFNFYSCWPTKWTLGAAGDESSESISIETLTFECEAI